MVRGAGDQAVEGVDLADQMALAEPAHRRVARHRADLVAAEADQRDRRAHPRRRRRRLGPGMAAADDDDVEILRHGRASNAFVPRGTSLSDAEAPEQRIEHVLDAGLAGDPVERDSRAAERLGDDQQIRNRFGLAQRRLAPRASAVPVPGVERDLALARQQRRGPLDQQAGSESSRPAPVVADTERSTRPGGRARDRPWRERGSRRAGRLGGRPQPEDQIRRLGRGAGAVDADRFDLVGRCRAGPAVSISRNGMPPKRDRRLDQVARRARNGRDDRRLPSDQRIEKAGLSGVRRAGDDDPDAVLEPLGGRAGEPAASASRKRAERGREIGGERARHRPRRRNRARPRPARRARAAAPARPRPGG